MTSSTWYVATRARWRRTEHTEPSVREHRPEGCTDPRTFFGGLQSFVAPQYVATPGTAVPAGAPHHDLAWGAAAHRCSARPEGPSWLIAPAFGPKGPRGSSLQRSARRALVAHRSSARPEGPSWLIAPAFGPKGVGGTVESPWQTRGPRTSRVRCGLRCLRKRYLLFHWYVNSAILPPPWST